MKVAMVGHKVIPSRRGGIENVLTSLCPLLVEKGIDVTCYNRSSDKVENEYIGTVRDKKYKGVTLKNAWTINRKGLSAMVASFTAAICATFGKYDIVHFHAEGPCAAMWIPKMFGKKCVATVHGLDWQREKWGKGFASKYIKFGEKVMVKCADEIIVLSESAREYFKQNYNRDTVLIHNGIDKPNKKEADEITKIYGLSKDEYICIVSRLTAEKGVHYLIDAYNSIKTNKKLVIAGDTSDTDEYVELLKQKALGKPDIIFTGFISGDVLTEIYSNAYVVTLPSDIEGMSLSLLEALAYGNAVLCSDIPENTLVKVGGTSNKYYDYAENDFAKQIEDYLNPIEKARKHPVRDSFLIGGTPKVFTDIGFNALPVTINKKHIDYAINGTKNLDHEVFIDVLKKIPEAMKSPIIVMENDTAPGRAVAVLKITAKNGKKLYLPVEIDGTAENNGMRIDSNAVLTLFGRGNVETKIKNALNNEAQGKISVFYWNKKEALALLQRGGQQSPTRLPQEGFVHSIRESGSNVKVRLNDVTESLQFKHWFGDWQKNPKKASKVVNADGTPKIMYHGSPEQFTIFDKKKAKASGLYGKGFYFTDSESNANLYGNLYAVYLDVKKPLERGKTTISTEQIRRYLESVAENEDYSIENYGTYNVSEILNKIQSRDAFSVIQDINATAIGDFVEAIKLFNEVNGTKFDGIVAPTETVVFEPNQIKSATDNIGTYSKFEEDFQFSDKDSRSVYDVMGEKERLLKDNEKLREDLDRLKERLDLERKLTHGNYFNENQLGAVAGHLRNISKSSYDKVTLMKRIKEVYSYIAHSPNVYWEEMYSMCHSIAEDMLKESKPDVIVNKEYKRILRELRNTNISLDSTQIAEAKYRFGNHYNRAFFNKVKISSDGVSLDTMWQDWSERYPEYFDPSVSSGNQIGELYDIIDSLQEASEIVEEYDMEEQTRWLATEIYNQYWNVSTVKTTADVYDKKIRRLNYEHRQAISELRNEYNERLEKKLATQKKADKEKYRQLVNQLRQRKNAEVAHAKELGKQKLTEYKENAERKAIIQKITANALDLNDKLVKNSKDKHIPEAMKGAVTELLQAIDFSSKRLLKGGDPTKKDVSLAKALGHLKDAITDGSQEIGDILDEMYGSGIDDLTKDLAKKSDEYLSEIDGETFTLNEMSNEDLKKLDTIVKTIRTTVNKINKFHVAQYNAGVQAHGVRSMEEIDSRKKIFKDDKKHFEKLKTHLYWNNLNPFYAFKNLGEASQRIFTALQDGQDKLAFLSQEVIDFTKKLYTAKQYQKWSDTYFEFSILQPNNKEAKFSMNVPQIMSLYCVTKQEDARRHILHGNENGEGGGITIVETKKKEAVRNNIRLTEAQLQTILDKLNDKSVGNAKEVADKLQEYMCRRGAELGNEVTMARWGIKSFGIENYFPIKVSEGSVPKKNDTPGVDSASMLELLNLSFTHARNKFAKQSVEIGDVFDVFSNHMSNMVRYNAMALPILDYYKWMNSRVTDEFGAEHSVQTSIKNTFGDHAWNYICTLLKDVSGATKKSSRDKMMVKFFKNAKIAKVAANIRVMALQFTSFIRAGAVIDNKYLLKSLNYFSTRELKDEAFKNSIAKAKKHCGIALWKSMGYYDTDITRGLSDQIKHNENAYDKIIEFSLKGAEKADEITWGWLWNTCEFEIRNTRTDLKAGSEEYYKAVGLRLREVIYQTQVVDSMLTRNQMMRSPDVGDKILTTFGSENALSFNLAMDVFVSYELDKRSMGKEKSKAKNKIYQRKAITAFIVTNVVTSALQTLFDAFRDYDEDEKDEEYWMKLMLGNFASNISILNKIPYINLLISTIQGFTPSRIDTDWMSNSIKAGKAMYKLFIGEGSTEKTIKYLLKALSDISGIAAYNVYRDIYALYELFND